MKELYRPLNKGVKRVLMIVSVIIPLVTLAVVGEDVEHPAALVPLTVIPVLTFWIFIFLVLWVRQGFLDEKRNK